MANVAQEINNNMVTLQSSDGKMFNVEKAVALKSNVLKMAIEGGRTTAPIRVQNVSSKILRMVIDYCEYHHLHDSQDAAATDTIKRWDAEFVKPLIDDPPTLLYELTMAAHYLDIYSLLELTSQTVADMMVGKNVEELRKMFNIKNDFSPEQEAEISREHEWS